LPPAKKCGGARAATHAPGAALGLASSCDLDGFLRDCKFPIGK
jgi:hypothetical protein